MVSIAFVFMMPVLAAAQQPAPTPRRPAATPSPAPTPTPKENNSPKENKSQKNNGPITGEQVAESSIIIYGYGGGRVILDQIRKTTIERGTTTVTQPDGTSERANYQKYIIRGGSLDKEKIRLDQEFPSVRYSLVKNADKVFMIYNDSVYNPREDAARAFHNQNFRGLDGLLRYKENESKLALNGKETKMGVEYHVLDVTDKAGNKTRYYISAKTLRVMMLEYEEGGAKYQRKFYDYNYAQGTLVPYKTVITKDGKVVEETEISTITFGQRVDEALFPQST
jgi:hypothetical protein